ncbi:phosphatase PAP2 family protein [Rubripirellula sp.]|nr:phosphatase PAP2 family protein [Rubripirellula sp.]MDB4622048.1 phosphatase PAP2 family protein [Rubripirellula sp.]
MSGSEETTEAKVTSHHSNPSRIRTSAARTDTGDSHNRPMRRSTPSAEIRYRPPQEETRKFHLAALLWLSIISLLLVPMATLLDVPIARWCHADHLPQEFSKMLDLSLIYAHGSGIFLILVAIMMMAPTKRWKMPRLATLALGSGAVATLVKMFVLRPRPNSLRLDLATNEHAWIWSFDWTLSRIAEYDAGTRAFPSGYLATATALTVGLWIVVPRGRPLFLAFCIGTMLQRLYCGSHFLSDLFGSAAVGLSWCYICYHPKLIGNVFDKMEAVQPTKRRAAETSANAYPLNSPSQSLSVNDTISPPSAIPAPHFIKDPVPSGSIPAGTMSLPDPSTQPTQASHDISHRADAARNSAAPTGYTHPSQQTAETTANDRPADDGQPRAA